MKSTIQTLVCVLAFSPVTHADVQTSVGLQATGYQRIVELNPFKLKPIPPQTVPLPAVPAENPSELKLTGIAASGGNKSAYFMLEQRGKSPRYITLAEGKACDGLEVVAIDVHAEMVRLRRDGVLLSLSLKTDGLKSAEQLQREEKKFVDQHTRAHEVHQLRERERVERERAEAERLLSQQQQSDAVGDDTLRSVIPAHPRSQEVFSARFSPDGRRILTTTPDGTARIWDAQTGQPLNGGAEEPNRVIR